MRLKGLATSRLVVVGVVAMVWRVAVSHSRAHDDKPACG